MNASLAPASPIGPVTAPRAHHVLRVLFGVLLPAVAIATKHMCAEEFFDPAPTLFHLLLLGLVPLHHTLLLCLPERAQLRLRLDLLGGMLIGVCAVYTVIFAPLMPLGLIAIPMLGLGFLPFAPLGALVMTIVAQRRLARLRQRSGVRLAATIASGVVLLAAAEAPVLVTGYGVREASSDDPDRAAEGVRFLRRYGDPESLSRTERRASMRVLPELAPPVTDALRYRVLGTLPVASDEERGWDPQRGSSAIGLLDRDLTLSTSRLDGSIDAEAALGYVEWTMVFENHGTRQAEARARIALPHGGVVSRATLWIDGEPREAVFGGRGQVRAAYQSVVSARRDPLLVTEVSPDVVQVQCFPIEAVGSMKIRLGISFPLDVHEARAARFLPPVLEARNFVVPASTAQHAWYESRAPLRLPGGQATQKDDGTHVLAFTHHAGLAGERGMPLIAERTGRAQSWAPLAADANAVIEQHAEVRHGPSIQRLAIVIDTSRAMAGQFEAIAAALSDVDALADVGVIVATDEGSRRLNRVGHGAAQIAGDVRALEAVGGIDNLPALHDAMAFAGPSGAVLWIHGPAPIVLGQPERLRSYFERGGQTLVHAQAVPGEHALLEALGSLRGLTVLPRYGDLTTDLKRQIAVWTGRGPTLHMVRRKREGTSLPRTSQTSDHLVRLWAREEIERLRDGAHEEALALAVTHRLVSPVSGAVVLESRAQYEAAGLTPASDQASVPSVPEPGTWLMLGVSVVMLTMMARRRRRMDLAP